jgi:hypothetical protein
MKLNKCNNFFNENVHFSVSYDFSKFDKSKKSRCDIPSGTTQRWLPLDNTLPHLFYKNATTTMFNKNIQHNNWLNI